MAEKQFESDVSRASAKVQSELPGRTTQAKKDAEKWGSEAGAKLDSAVSTLAVDTGLRSAIDIFSDRQGTRRALQS